MLRVDVPAELIHGGVDEGYGAIADEFRRNFAERGDVGAACAVYRDGRKVVDLWGGYRDGPRRLPWDRDTLVMVWSTTKGMASIAIALAHSRGWLDFDERVAAYWPEFAANGKAAITVRQLLSHQAGLAVVDAELDVKTLADPDALSTILAQQAPSWEPGSRCGYNAVTLGLYQSELLRRVDPAHRTLGRFFADEVAAPLDIEFYIGLPEAVGDDRLATLHVMKRAELLRHLDKLPGRFVLGLLNPRSVTGKAFSNPKFLRDMNNLNRRDLLGLELPAFNGIGQPRAIAKAYGCLANGGQELGISQRTIEQFEKAPTPPVQGIRDVVLQFDVAWSLGFAKPMPDLPFGTAAGQAFGTAGAGGSFGFADPDVGIGFCYAMNRMGAHRYNDPREAALRNALYEVIVQ